MAKKAEKLATGSNVVSLLAATLADTYALALKTQNYHWNVTGREFFSLHKLFEEQYEGLHEAADELAERLRALGAYAPGSFEEFGKLTAIKSATKGADADQMLEDLAKSHELLVSGAKKLIAAAEVSDDAATADIIVGRIEEHQKMVWMLRSSLKGKK